MPSKQCYCKKCITWSDISGRNFAARYCDKGFVFDVKGSSGFPNELNYDFVLALLNSKITPKYIDSLNPTQSTQVGDLKRIPIIFPDSEIIKNQISQIAIQCVNIAKDSYDSFETSWDFEQHPLLRFKENGKVEDSFNKWKEYKQEQFNKLKAKEEEAKRRGEWGDVNIEFTPRPEEKMKKVSTTAYKRYMEETGGLDIYEEKEEKGLNDISETNLGDDETER